MKLKEEIILVYADVLTIRKSLIKNNVDGQFNTTLMICNDTTSILDNMLERQLQTDEDGVTKND